MNIFFKKWFCCPAQIATYAAMVLLSSYANASTDASIVTPEPVYDLSDISEDQLHEHDTYDPLEPYNRTMFVINKSMDKLLIRPVAVLYRDIVPDWSKDRVHSAIWNSYVPVRIVNAILQTDEKALATIVGRFLSNTILGFGGLIDIAAEADESLKPVEMGFGSTLKHYGVDMGVYIILPVVGPSTIRSAVGLGVDMLTDPFNYNHLTCKDFVFARGGVIWLDKRYRLLKATDLLEDTSIDEYSAMRSAYLQKQ